VREPGLCDETGFCWRRNSGGDPKIARIAREANVRGFSPHERHGRNGDSDPLSLSLGEHRVVEPPYLDGKIAVSYWLTAVTNPPPSTPRAA